MKLAFLLFLTWTLQLALSEKIDLKDDRCSSYDSCSVGDFFRTCNCEEDCYQYGNCCYDAPSMMADKEQLFTCRQDNVMTPAFARRRCAPDFAGSRDVISGCHNSGENMADVVGNLIVSSNETMDTYWNWNCAICNHEEPSSILHWSVQVTCPVISNSITEEVVHSNLLYAKPYWGLKVDDQFIRCSVTFIQPDPLVNRLKYCAPNMISSCPVGYHNREVIKKCEEYHGERKLRGKDRYFKNVYCALCNGASLKYLECFGRNYRPLIHASDSRVIKVLFKSGTWIGDLLRQYECSVGEAYDPFTNQCRSFILPNHDAVNSFQCVTVPTVSLVFMSLIMSIIDRKIKRFC